MSPNKALDWMQYLEAHLALRDEPPEQGSPEFDPHFVNQLLGIRRGAIEHNLLSAHLDHDRREKFTTAMNKLNAMQETINLLMSRTPLEFKISAAPEPLMPVHIESSPSGTDGPGVVP
jgi:hypothetical protein